MLTAATLVACGGGEASPPPSDAASSSTTTSDGGAGSGGDMGTTTTTSGDGGGGGSTVEPICPAGMSYGDPLAGAGDASLVGDGYNFTEGPLWLADQGVLLFSDMRFSDSGSEGWPPSTIHQLTPPSTFDVFLDPSGSNGLALDMSGDIVACTHDERSVSRIDPVSKARQTIVDTFMGDKFSSPNDAIVRSDGTIYFTDPTWQLGNRTQEIPFKGVYRLPPGGDAILVSDALGSPNGIALSPDETLLYVADDASGNVQRFDVDSGGATGSATLFTNVPGADGMAMDCAGNLYVTAQGAVRVFEPDGTELGSIAVAEKPSNCAFGGDDRTTLFITAQDGVYSVELAVPGFP